MGTPLGTAPWTGLPAAVVCGLAAAAGLLLAACGTTAAEPLPSARTAQVTTGAAPGYVDDQVCAGCHQKLFASYQEVGMARAFTTPEKARVIEDFDAEPYFHEPSRRYYQMRRTPEGEITFRRYQLDDEDREINALELGVTWVLGSGNRSRTYLYRSEASGELTQLPLAWYSQEGVWRMSPGYDKAHHLGLARRVPKECMFCHNAYPEVPAGSDGYREPNVFPAELPHGIGCQRCHGPGGEHVRLGYADEVDFQALSASILDPADLDPARRQEICYQCHFQPTVTLMGLRRFDRGVYSYRPGEPLGDYLAVIDVEEQGLPKEERFEINHHPYRLEQSVCGEPEGTPLSCLRCHDPHRKVPPEQRTAHYRAACLECHQLEDCDLQTMAAEAPAHLAATAPDDCVACHMPQRRTQDVIHAVMTDHRIQNPPSTAEELQAYTAPLEEDEPVVLDTRVIGTFGREASGLSEADAEIYRALAVLRAGGTGEAAGWLQRRLDAHPQASIEPYLDLSRWQLRSLDLTIAHVHLSRLLEDHPDDPQIMSMLSVVELGQGRRLQALRLAQRAAELAPDRPELQFNLGRLLLGYDRASAALPHLRRAVELRPIYPPAWSFLGLALTRLEGTEGASSPGPAPSAPLPSGFGTEDVADAAAALRLAVAIDPGFSQGYVTLANLLLERGERAEALRFLRHGVENARNPTSLNAALDRVLEPAPPPKADPAR